MNKQPKRKLTLVRDEAKDYSEHTVSAPVKLMKRSVTICRYLSPYIPVSASPEVPKMQAVTGHYYNELHLLLVLIDLLYSSHFGHGHLILLHQ